MLPADLDQQNEASFAVCMSLLFEGPYTWAKDLFFHLVVFGGSVQKEDDNIINNINNNITAYRETTLT